MPDRNCQSDAPSFPRRRILLVEDNDAARTSLARFLEAKHFDVTSVNDGLSAVQALADNPPPDFLLTDLSLPDLDGREVARLAHERLPGLRVALITGWDVEMENANKAAWGIDWVVPKPIDVRGLLALLAPVEPGTLHDK